MVGWKPCHVNPEGVSYCGCLDEDACLQAPKNQAWDGRPNGVRMAQVSPRKPTGKVFWPCPAYPTEECNCTSPENEEPGNRCWACERGYWGYCPKVSG